MSTSSSSELFDLGQASGHLVRRAQQRHARHWSQIVGANLTSPQYAVLHVLGRRPDIDLTELGSRAALDRTTVGRVVTRLGDDGLVASAPGHDDRRRRLVALTDAGRRLLAATAPRAAEVNRRLLEDLTDDEAGELISLLGRVVASDVSGGHENSDVDQADCELSTVGSTGQTRTRTGA